VDSKRSDHKDDPAIEATDLRTNGRTGSAKPRKPDVIPEVNEPFDLPESSDTLTNSVHERLDRMAQDFISTFDSIVSSSLKAFEDRSLQTIAAYQAAILEKTLLQPKSVCKFFLSSLECRKSNIEQTIFRYLKSCRTKRLLRAWSKVVQKDKSRRSNREKLDWRACIIDRFEEKLASLRIEKEKAIARLIEEENELAELQRMQKEYQENDQGLKNSQLQGGKLDSKGKMVNNTGERRNKSAKNSKSISGIVYNEKSGDISKKNRNLDIVESRGKAPTSKDHIIQPAKRTFTSSTNMAASISPGLEVTGQIPSHSKIKTPPRPLTTR
jgi:hypothetical protein